MSVKRRIMHHTGDAIFRYNLIEDGDKILVGFSGGKDSFALLDILISMEKKAPVHYDIIAVIIDANFKTDYSRAIQYLKDNNIKYHVEKTIINEIIESNPPKNPCFMCARLRRGVMYRVAQKLKCNKIALGHHLDDAMETLLLNIFYSSKLLGLKPKVFAEDKVNIVIRPLIHVHEKDIIEYTKEKNFPLIPEDCLFQSKESKRLKMKNLLKDIGKENKFLHSSMKNIMDELYKLKEK